jgi:hypothetical protein
MTEFDFDDFKRKRTVDRARQENEETARAAELNTLLRDLRDQMHKAALAHGAEWRDQTDGAVLERAGETLRVIMRLNKTYDIVENRGVEVEQITKEKMMNRVMDGLERP